jgi:hydrogenase maturation protease
VRSLIAGLGNIFHSDDGFGVAVAESLRDADLPEGAELHDFGIRGIHLAYQLVDGYDLVVIADAVSRGGTPGTLYVIEHEADADRAPTGDAPMLDAHDMDPDEVLALVPVLGGEVGRTVVVGCEPAHLGAGMGLSPAVQRSVGQAANLVTDIVCSAHTDSSGRIDAPSPAGGK